MKKIIFVLFLIFFVNSFLSQTFASEIKKAIPLNLSNATVNVNSKIKQSNPSNLIPSTYHLNYHFQEFEEIVLKTNAFKDFEVISEGIADCEFINGFEVQNILEEKIVSLELLSKKYGIKVVDESKYLKQEDIIVLNSALSLFGENVIKKIIEFYKSVGVSFSITILNPTEEVIKKGTLAYAFQEGSASGVNLYTPKGYFKGGIHADVIAHELGHIVHYILDYQVGEQKLKEEYTKLNKGEQYDDNYKPEEQYIFPNEYGSTNYYEDFASMFELFAKSPNEMKSKISTGKYFALHHKAKVIKQFAESYFGKFNGIFNLIE